MKLPIQVNEREKRFLILGGIIAAAIIAFSLYSWYSDTRRGVEGYRETRRATLEAQLQQLSKKESLKKRASAIRQVLERQEKRFLPGGKPPVAAATLQKILKESAAGLNIEVKLERTLNPGERNLYLAIPVEIGFNSTTGELSNLLRKLRESPYLLTVSEMKVRVTNVRDPQDVYTSLVVTGFIRKPAEEDREGGERTSAT